MVRNAATVSQSVVSYATIIEVANDDLKLKPGMTANVSIIVTQRNNILKVPNQALRVRLPQEIQAKVAAVVVVVVAVARAAVAAAAVRTPSPTRSRLAPYIAWSVIRMLRRRSLKP